MKKHKFIKIFLASFLIVFAFLFSVNFSLAACVAGSGNANEICFTNPLQYDTVEGLLVSLMDGLRAIVVVLSLVFIVIGAVMYIVSSGNEKLMTMGKNAIMASMIGLAIGIAAPSFLHEIYSIAGEEDATIVCADLEGEAMDECQRVLEGSLTLSQIALNVLNFLLSIVGVLSIIMLVAAGMMYITAAGDEGRMETGKNMAKWAIVGTAVALGAMVIVKQIARFFV